MRIMCKTCHTITTICCSRCAQRELNDTISELLKEFIERSN